MVVRPPPGLQAFERRPAPVASVPAASTLFASFGTITRGLSTVGEAFQTLRHVFQVSPCPPPSSVSSSLTDNRPPTRHYPDASFSPRLLQRHPVDLLVVDNGDRSRGNVAKTGELWEAAIARVAKTKKAPHVVCESWIDSAVSWEGGPASKAWEHRWIAFWILQTCIRPRGERIWRRHRPAPTYCSTNPSSARRFFRLARFGPSRCTPYGQPPRPSGPFVPRPSLPGFWSLPAPSSAFLPHRSNAMELQVADRKPLLLPIELSRGLGLPKTYDSLLHEKRFPDGTRLLVNTTSVYDWEFAVGAGVSLLPAAEDSPHRPRSLRPSRQRLPTRPLNRHPHRPPHLHVLSIGTCPISPWGSHGGVTGLRI